VDESLFCCGAIALPEVKQCKVHVGAFVARLEFNGLIQVASSLGIAILEDVRITDIREQNCVLGTNSESLFVMVFSVTPIFVQIGGHGQAMVGIRVVRRFIQDFAIESSGILTILSSECSLRISNQPGLSFDGRQFGVVILRFGICLSGELFLAVDILWFGRVVCSGTFLHPGPKARQPFRLP